MKLLLLSLLLTCGSLQAGTNTERGNWESFLIQRNCDPIEYEELYADCVAIKHILERMIGSDIDSLVVGQHIEAYLNTVGTRTAYALYEDFKNIQFDI